MSLTVQTVIIGVIAFVVNLFASTAAQWIIWGGYLLFSLVLLSKGLSGRKNGNESDWTSGVMLPPAMIAVLILLAVSLFVSVNKFHLLWATVLVVFIIETLISKRVLWPMQRNLEEKISKGTTDNKI